MVAVVIPAHNAADYIDVALGSVGDQSTAIDGIILVDVGSTDDTIGLVKEWSGTIRLELALVPKATAGRLPREMRELDTRILN